MQKLISGIPYLLFCILLLSCNRSASSSNLIENADTPPVIILPDVADAIEVSMASLLAESFLKTTGLSISIQKESSVKEISRTKIHIGNTNHNLKSSNFNQLKNDGYCIEFKNETISLFGKNIQGIQNGVIAFIKTYLGAFYVAPNEFNYVKKSRVDIKNNEVIISNPAFEYREAFFPSAMQPDFTVWNMSHNLENEWLIWGHNLPKFLKDQPLPLEAYALINGERRKEQFCFSNKILLTTTKKLLAQKVQEGFEGKRVAIWPNDNGMVCSCMDCVELGCTNVNATPAVNHFITQLANEFKQLQFFTSSYYTTEKPSTQKLPSNTGVFISTINYPKNLPLSNSKYKEEFEQRVKAWKNSTPRIYIWDYAVNYTLYSDFFPNLKGLQQDLKYFRTLDVNGVFVQGSDYDYSTFEDIKSYTISGLLWNPNLNIDSLRYTYIEQAYPEHVEYINDYLVQIENVVFNKKSPLSIYAGVSQPLGSYLDPAGFELFYYGLSEKMNNAASGEKARLLKAYTMLTHLKLEVMRGLGVNTNGYADISNEYEYVPKKEIGILQATLDSLSKKADVSILNEPKLSVEDYLVQWKSYIEAKACVNKFYKGNYSIKSSIDEGYEKKASYILTDGALGFLDYETNWLLSTNKPLELEIETSTIKSCKELSFNFLSNVRHSIFSPTRIEIYELPSKKLLALYTKKTIDESESIRKISLNIDLRNSTSILIRMFPDSSQNSNKTAIACDEILFQ